MVCVSLSRNMKDQYEYGTMCSFSLFGERLFCVLTQIGGRETDAVAIEILLLMLLLSMLLLALSCNGNAHRYGTGL